MFRPSTHWSGMRVTPPQQQSHVQPGSTAILLQPTTLSESRCLADAFRSALVKRRNSAMAASEAAAPRVGSPVPQDSTCMKTFPDSSFFKERPASELPSPAEIRALNAESGDMRAESFGRPSPVIVPSLGLFVKYGADVTVAEMETQIRMRELLQGQVPIPEVFGWAEDGGQTFIYMSLVSGDTLQARWGSMSESEREAVCQKLRPMVNAWRTLPQEGGEPYVGECSHRPVHSKEMYRLLIRICFT